MSGGLLALPRLEPWIMRRCDRATGEQAVATFVSLTGALTAIVRSEGIDAVHPELWIDPLAEGEAAATAPLEYCGGRFRYLLDRQAV